jgi:hypothetical protein
MNIFHPLIIRLKTLLIEQRGFAQTFALLFIFANVVPGFKAIENLSFYGMLISWIWAVKQQGFIRGLQRINIVAWLGLALFCWILLVLKTQGEFANNWHSFFYYTSLGKALLIGTCLSFCNWSARALNYLCKMLLLLLLLVNLRQLYLMWHFQVLFDFTHHPYEVLWKIRDCGQPTILLCPFLFSALSTTQHKGIKAILSCWLILQIILLLGTGFRGAYLGFFISLIVWLWFSERRRWVIALFTSFVVIYTSVMLLASENNIVYQAFKRGKDDSRRMELVWKPSWHMIKQAPWHGHGFGQKRFMLTYDRYQATHPQWTMSHLTDTHNVALSVGFAAGIPAMLLYGILLLSVVFILGRLYLRSQKQQRAIALFSLAVLCAWLALFGILGQTDIVKWEYFAVLLGLTAICQAHGRNK